MPFLAADPKTFNFNKELLWTCYKDSDTILKYNEKIEIKSAEQYTMMMCGKLLMQAKENGIGIIFLDMHEGARELF